MKTNNTPAAIISAYNLEALAQTNGTHEITVNTSKEFYTLHDYLVFTLGWDCYEYAHVSQDGSVTINIRVNNNQPEPTNPDNTPAIMNANETNAKTLTASILDELNARKCRGTWDNAVNAYAVELVESLDNWNKQPESVAELREMMLNGAADWTAYSWGGSSLIYNWDIAERLCTPSELRRLTRKDGTLNDSPRGVHLLDIQARALFQAANRVARIAAKHFYA